MNIVNNALELSKIEADKIDLESHDFYLNELIEESIRSLNASALDKKVLIYVDYDPKLLVNSQFKGDFRRLKQVLVNLLYNSVRSTNNGEVLIGVGLEDETLNEVILGFQVIDTGKGFNENKREVLLSSIIYGENFDSFVKNMSKDSQGFFICKTFIEKMGGRLRFKSNYLNGSNFFFTVHLQKGKSSTQNINLILKSKKVLVLSKHEGLLSSITKIFISWGAVVHHRNYTINDYLNFLENLQPMESGSKSEYDIIFNINQKLPEEHLLHKKMTELTHSHLLSCYLFDDSSSDLEFSLTYPIKLCELYKSIDKLFGEKGEPIKNIRILIVEDNMVNSQVFQRMLIKKGYQVDLSNNGKDAVDMVKINNYQVVFMDVNIPGLNGMDSTKAIRSLSLPFQPIIVATTGETSKEIAEECLKSGMNHFLTKPIDTFSLNKILNSVT